MKGIRIPPRFPGIRSCSRAAAIYACLLCLQGCAVLQPDTALVSPFVPADLVAASADECLSTPAFRDGRATRVTDPATADRVVIDPDAIELFNWNIGKGGRAKWAAELARLAGEADIVTLQEAPLSNPGWAAAKDERVHAFAPGYATRQSSTGVMTVSAARPLRQCNLSSREPLIRSPKATLITEYALLGRDQTLLVVNIHAINFAPGLRAFERQLGMAADVVARHDGPVIVAGDFNTWRPARQKHVDERLDALELRPVAFAVDRRKRFFGQALDHVYVRGLYVVTATSYASRASDHNPMRVRLSM